MMTTKDGKLKPAKIISIDQTAPCSCNIVTTQGQQYRRNRKDLRKLPGGTSIGTNVDDFVDNDPHVVKSTESTTGNCDDSEPVPPITSAPAMRRSNELSEHQYDTLTNTHNSDSFTICTHCMAAHVLIRVLFDCNLYTSFCNNGRCNAIREFYTFGT